MKNKLKTLYLKIPFFTCLVIEKGLSIVLIEYRQAQNIGTLLLSYFCKHNTD